MKILFVTPYLAAPPNFGGARRMYSLIREAATRHEVITLSLTGPADDITHVPATLGKTIAVPVRLTARLPPGTAKRRAQLRAIFSRASFQRAFYHHSAMQRRIDEIVQSERVDLVQFEFSQMGSYTVPGDTPTVLDVHNIEHDVLRQMASSGALHRRLFNLLEYRKFRREEISAWNMASVAITTSSLDAATIAQHTGQTVEVIPNGVDLDEFPRTPLDGTDPASLVFIGAMRYRPNAEAAHLLATEILPLVRRALPEARVSIVGADPPPDVLALDSLPGVQVTGTVPDVRPWLHQAGTVVVPLRSGGGTRLKILEAFAAGRPVVSTTIGAAGLDARDEEHLLIADSPQAIASAIIRLAGNTTLRNQLTTASHELVRAQYSWSAIGERADLLYAALTSNAPMR